MSEYVTVWVDGLPDIFPGGEEIVRCRDCVRGEEYAGRLLCHKFSVSDRAGWPVEPDGFCAWGKRRNDG